MSNLGPWIELRELAKGLAPGTADGSRTCPKCGQSGSFSVFANPEGHGWKCHRASCGHSRFYRTGPRPEGASLAIPELPARPIRPYPFPLVFPDPDNPIWERMRVAPADRTGPEAAKYGLFAREGFASEIVWRLRDVTLRTIGHVSRDYATKTIRTWRLASTGVLYGYFPAARSTQLWLVEDCVSAARLAREGGVDSIALLGTHVGADLEADLDQYLMRFARVDVVPQVVVALDADATEKAVKYVRRLSAVLPARVLFAPLKRDIKDLEPGKIEKLVEYFTPTTEGP